MYNNNNSNGGMKNVKTAVKNPHQEETRTKQNICYQIHYTVFKDNKNKKYNDYYFLHQNIKQKVTIDTLQK